MDQLAFRAQPTLDVGPRRRRVGLDQLGRSAARRLDERAVAAEIGEAEQRVPALPLADIFAGPPQLEIVARDLESIAVLADHLQPRARGVRQVFPEEEDADAVARPAPDAPAQLVQLGKAEALRAFDHHQRRIRHVHADLDHRGAYQKIDFPGLEAVSYTHLRAHETP